MQDKYVGRTVVLFGCMGYNDKNVEIRLTGTFTVEDRYLYEPSSYCYSNGFMLFPVGLNLTEEQAERAFVYVDDDQFFPQVDPKVWGQCIRAERDLENSMDIEWERLEKEEQNV